jgi:hypothetical protein
MKRSRLRLILAYLIWLLAWFLAIPSAALVLGIFIATIPTWLFLIILGLFGLSAAALHTQFLISNLVKGHLIHGQQAKRYWMTSFVTLVLFSAVIGWLAVQAK